MFSCFAAPSSKSEPHKLGSVEPGGCKTAKRWVPLQNSICLTPSILLQGREGREGRGGIPIR